MLMPMHMLMPMLMHMRMHMHAEHTAARRRCPLHDPREAF